MSRRTVKILLLSAFTVFFLAAGGYFIYVKKPEFKNILVIGWDGTSRDRLEELLANGELPALQSVIKTGSFVAIDISQGATTTKPGWAQIFSGYRTQLLQVKNNRVYDTIPENFTIFEKLKSFFGSNEIVTFFISGKAANVGARGPHKICINCISRSTENRESTAWYDEKTTAPTANKKPRRFVVRNGEPFFHAAKTMNLFVDKLGGGETVLEKAFETLDLYKDKKFFGFVHFRDPDERGHVYGENSKEYLDGIRENDVFLQRLIDFLQSRKLDNTLVFIVSDHGMDPNSNENFRAPATFLVANIKNLRKKGDRMDVAPTIYDLYGFDPDKFEPKLSGRSLFYGSEFK